uniref:Guanylate cyclase domain-containing protein n=1 Tax=Macrostomum lignano TaxID=282301 RepID=A0A1I8JPL2_9PLAT
RSSDLKGFSNLVVLARQQVVHRSALLTSTTRLFSSEAAKVLAVAGKAVSDRCTDLTILIGLKGSGGTGNKLEGNEFDSAELPPSTDPRWQLWGPYMSQREWGTRAVRHYARRTAFSACAIAATAESATPTTPSGNYRDDHLKERFSTLTNSQGAQREDVKEVYSYKAAEIRSTTLPAMGAGCYADAVSQKHLVAWPNRRDDFNVEKTTKEFHLGYYFDSEAGVPEILLTDNVNSPASKDASAHSPSKDAFHRYITRGDSSGLIANLGSLPAQQGRHLLSVKSGAEATSQAAMLSNVPSDRGESATLNWKGLTSSMEMVRLQNNVDTYQSLPGSLVPAEQDILNAAYTNLLWNRQYYPWTRCSPCNPDEQESMAPLIYDRLHRHLDWWLQRRDARGVALIDGGICGVDYVSLFPRELVETGEGLIWALFFAMASLMIFFVLEDFALCLCAVLSKRMDSNHPYWLDVGFWSEVSGGSSSNLSRNNKQQQQETQRRPSSIQSESIESNASIDGSCVSFSMEVTRIEDLLARAFNNGSSDWETRAPYVFTDAGHSRLFVSVINSIQLSELLEQVLKPEVKQQKLASYTLSQEFCPGASVSSSYGGNTNWY